MSHPDRPRASRIRRFRGHPLGELLVEFAHGQDVIRSRQVAGLAMRRQWLGDGTAPKTEAALAEILDGFDLKV